MVLEWDVGADLQCASSVCAKQPSGKGRVMPKPLVDSEGAVRELDEAFFSRAKRGRPSLPDGTRKRHVNLMLDPDVAVELQQKDNSSAFVNALLRRKLGL